MLIDSSIHGAQLLGAPLYFISRNHYYAFMAVTKQYFAVLLTVGTQYWSPTVIRISGDASVKGQLRQTSDGRLECDFPERLVLLANHQIYTDWLYLWWIAYTAGTHGYLYIILKQSLKWVPIIGPAMQFYSFIFMARKWASDQERMRYRLRKLNAPRQLPHGQSALDPMWLLLFPEGTNLSANTRRQSKKWSEKKGIPDTRHTILPRSMGLQFCLQELGKTCEYIYDCTIAYEKILPGQFGQDVFTLRSVYFQGRPPKSVNMYWRRFKISDIPVNDEKAMEDWILQRWREKDDLLEHHLAHDRFPADPAAVVFDKGGTNTGYIETEVRPKSPFELLQMFVPIMTAYLIWRILGKLVQIASTGRMSSI